ncbi:MAG TPA: GWxTD domain-containing protein, partial [bacterium]
MLTTKRVLKSILVALVFPASNWGMAYAQISPAMRISTQPAPYDSIETEYEYFSLLRAAGLATFESEFEAEFMLVLDPAQMDQYRALTALESRKAYITRYWEIYNPNPLLPQNDRLLDHLRRRTYARSNFEADTPPYYDDRGKYWVKYGKPKFRYRDYGGERSMEGLVSIPFRYYSVIPNESWSYVNVWPNYVVHFMQKAGGFAEITSLKEVIVDSHRKGRVVWYWSDLLKRRFWMSSLVTNTVNAIEQLEIEAAVANGGNRVMMDRVGSLNVRISDKMFTSLSQAEHEMQLASLEVPATTYDPIEAKNRIPVVSDIAQFRGEGGKTRVALTMIAPLKNFINRKQALGSNEINAEFNMLISNQSYDSLAAAAAKNHFPLGLSLAENISSVVGYLTFELSPMSVELAYQIRNLNDNRIGFQQND